MSDKINQEHLSDITRLKNRKKKTQQTSCNDDRTNDKIFTTVNDLSWMEKLRKKQLNKSSDFSLNQDVTTNDLSQSNESFNEHKEQLDLGAVDWANSLFGQNVKPMCSLKLPTNTIAETDNAVLNRLRERPFNVEMITGIELRGLEPFWRTETHEKIEQAWNIERQDLVDTFSSKHKAATRNARKTISFVS